MATALATALAATAVTLGPLGARAAAMAPSAAANAARPHGAHAATAPATAAAKASPRIPPPVHQGTLRILGQFRDGAVVTATGLTWRPPRLPKGMTLLTFEVAYSWQGCTRTGRHCATAQDSTATPFAADRYIAGHADTGRRLRVTETATEVVETQAPAFSFTVIHSAVSRLSPSPVAAYPRHERPATAFVNGTPEPRTASAEEYFQVAPPHYSAADGPPAQWYRIDRGRWRPVPASRVFYTGTLRPGPHRVTVRTANRAGATETGFGWQVVPLPPPAPCGSSRQQPCWYPPHLAADHRPMRWDWQIGLAAPLQRTGGHAVDIYDTDGFLTTPAEVRAIHTRWQASTLRHPKTVCYLDLAWEDYRPDASPSPRGYFPATVLGTVYYGYPDERWVDLRQLGALEPMLSERIGMCARKGFDAVELDDIDGFDPPSTTGFWLTPGDAQNFLAYAFSEIHRHGMTALWKNSPWLSWWGRRYADGAVVEECYLNQNCFAAQSLGMRAYGITCTALRAATPCGWDGFTADVTRQQPTGKWVGEAEYAEDNYVCDPGQRCPRPRRFRTFCAAVYSPPDGFAAVKFDVALDASMFYPCPRGS
ncbi:MAG: endo alpha-1,4 polygalactosaminidase [Streptosporangiaceae bacterium]|nr:endo alpha-1,4 polygalactosaminidase [Streptosporangiaceae bacterium]